MWQALKNLWQKSPDEQTLGAREQKIGMRGFRHQPKRREFIIIGLGRFGSSVAETLIEYGHDVLAIDIDAERVQHLSTELPHVLQLDATNADALRQIGVDQFETGLVAISTNFESNIVATMLLLQAGVKRVISKARTRTQKTILETVGAHEVILPEHEAGVHLGHKLAFSHMVDYLEMSRGVGIVELVAPESLCGQSLQECRLRQQYNLTVIAIHRGEDILVNPQADFRILSGDVLAVVGRIEDAERLQG